MLKLLTDQTENYNNKEEKNIKIIVCNDNIDIHTKTELFLKETNYSPNHVFLDV